MTMRVVKSIKTMRALIKKAKAQNKTVGFVPTMGALHEGHRSLVCKCRRENGLSVMSIFVNPKQFGPREDFAKYPRDQKRDELFAKNENVDIIFYPSERLIYPNGYLTYVQVEQYSSRMCGVTRPGHFRGVTTVMVKLLNIITPDVLYLGQKDAQQAVILNKMVEDLNFPVTIKMCPIIRDRDGLAMSSRNTYLTSRQRQEAPMLFQSLKKAKRMIRNGEHNAKKIMRVIRSSIVNNTCGKIVYVVCMHASTLASMKYIRGKVMIALSVKFGHTRLIDNIIINVK
jgi:pantoate--beta-alanine ligase